MVHLRGLSWNKTRELLEELERAEVIAQIQDENGWTWAALPKNAIYWIGSTEAIPAGIVQVAHRFSDART